MLSGCCRRAPQAIQEAQLARESALAAGAGRYASSLLEQSRTKLVQAEEFRRSRRCKQAAEVAEGATSLAYEAEIESSRKVESSRAAFEDLMPLVQERLQELREEPRRSGFDVSLQQLRNELRDDPLASPTILEELCVLEHRIQDLIEAIREREEERLRAEEQARKAAPEAPPPVPRLSSRLRMYVVKPGDSLQAIAARRGVYGDASRWRELYEFNRDRIGDPNRLFVGQEIVIPRIAEGESP